ncbi:MAG: fasciclin domain-containing protein [Egibacteraceae bacterium]
MTQARMFKTALATGLLGLTLAARGGADETATVATDTETPASAPSEPAPEVTPEATAEAELAAGPFGPGCAAVPASGAGSFEGMATAPVATAASANPLLSTLVTAVTEAGLVDTLNSAEGITVFAPSNDAFAKIPAADLQALLADKEMLTQVLTYHVVGQPVTPAELGTAGPFTSLQGGTVEAAGSGEEFTVNDSSEVVCGGVETANATVYIVDTVLMPPAA